METEKSWPLRLDLLRSKATRVGMALVRMPKGHPLGSTRSILRGASENRTAA